MIIMSASCCREYIHRLFPKGLHEVPHCKKSTDVLSKSLVVTKFEVQV